MIVLRKVSIVAGQFSLRAISFKVEDGQYAVLMGKTGSGKTTILESICGLRKVTYGKIILDGREVTDLPPTSSPSPPKAKPRAKTPPAPNTRASSRPAPGAPTGAEKCRAWCGSQTLFRSPTAPARHRTQCK